MGLFHHLFGKNNYCTKPASRFWVQKVLGSSRHISSQMALNIGLFKSRTAVSISKNFLDLYFQIYLHLWALRHSFPQNIYCKKTSFLPFGLKGTWQEAPAFGTDGIKTSLCVPGLSKLPRLSRLFAFGAIKLASTVSTSTSVKILS